ncbi:hypothetical protein [Noviherbaspirillum sp.]|uniref:hypothetical protein n=1 Tax=Noviherbaspirillum sp. TaxID=1926288 RepID=UPI002FE39EC3
MNSAEPGAIPYVRNAAHHQVTAAPLKTKKLHMNIHAQLFHVQHLIVRKLIQVPLVKALCMLAYTYAP